MARRLGVSAALVGGVLRRGDVEVDDGVVSAVGLPPARGDRIAVPGLVDVQCNGYAGVDVTGLGRQDPGTARADVATLRHAVARDGVTAVVPTLITAEPATTTATLAVLDAARPDPQGARLLGAHLEGPFLSPARPGTHPTEHLRRPDPDVLGALLAAGEVAIATLAPELDGAGGLVSRLLAAGITVMAGHSDATAAEAHHGFETGVRGATHLGNAMSGLDHRAPGLAAAALTHPGAVVTVIADGLHVHPDIVALVAAAAPGRWALITDATAAAGMPDGAFRLGDVDVVLTEGAVRRHDGTLAGSAATLVGCVRTCVAAGISPERALVAATATPAGLVPPAAHPHPDLGVLRPGGVADVTVLDDAFAAVTTLVAGRDVAEVGAGVV